MADRLAARVVYAVRPVASCVRRSLDVPQVYGMRGIFRVLRFLNFRQVFLKCPLRLGHTCLPGALVRLQTAVDECVITFLSGTRAIVLDSLHRFGMPFLLSSQFAKIRISFRRSGLGLSRDGCCEQPRRNREQPARF